MNPLKDFVSLLVIRQEEASRERLDAHGRHLQRLDPSPKYSTATPATPGARYWARLLLRSRCGGRFGEQALDGRGDLFFRILVEHAAHRTRETGVDRPHQAVAADEDRRRE